MDATTMALAVSRRRSARSNEVGTEWNKRAGQELKKVVMDFGLQARVRSSGGYIFIHFRIR
jgi:hypothetical protein